jgi:hypothetical protein
MKGLHTLKRFGERCPLRAAVGTPTHDHGRVVVGLCGADDNSCSVSPKKPTQRWRR